MSHHALKILSWKLLRRSVGGIHSQPAPVPSYSVPVVPTRESPPLREPGGLWLRAVYLRRAKRLSKSVVRDCQ